MIYMVRDLNQQPFVLFLKAGFPLYIFHDLTIVYGTKTRGNQPDNQETNFYLMQYLNILHTKRRNAMTNKKDAFFSDLEKRTLIRNTIPPELNTKYQPKRGLRNADGTGVLAGLTKVGEVHGYVIDEGEKTPVEGRLMYRGIDVKEIVTGFQADNRFGFEETCYLLLMGELPTAEQTEEFREMLNRYRALPENFTEDMILKAPSPNIMNKLARAVLSLYSYDDDAEDRTLRNTIKQSVKLISRFPVMTAYAYQTKNHYYDNGTLHIRHIPEGLSTAEVFLSLVRANGQYTNLEAEILDLALVLHAEHGGGNNSAFTVRAITSSDTDTYSAIAAGIGSLKGYKHGGANIKVLQMVDNIKENVKSWDNEKQVEDYLAKIIRKEAFDNNGLVYGMGHAIYTYSDPRAGLLKEKAELLAKEKGHQEELSLYHNIEKLTPGLFHEIKQSEKIISANVDLYSGFVYQMLGIPDDLYTPLFAMSRISGWCAHRIEEIISGGRIIRPAYKCVQPKRPYTPMGDRMAQQITE